MLFGPVQELPQRMGFLLLPQFSMMAVTAAIEPLRLANRLAGQELYAWDLFSQDGLPAFGSNGIAMAVSGDLKAAESLPAVIVCGGLDTHRISDRTLFSWLRRVERQGRDIGALCTGGHLLANAGLLNGHRCTVHWENLPAFSEDFPRLEVTAQLYEIDRKRFTCAGGTAAIDMMLYLIGVQHGSEIAGEVAEQIIHERIRDPGEHQRLSLPARLGIRHPKLLAIIDLMQENLEEPLERVELARGAGLSTRQLERLFRKYLNRSPARYYLELRLNRARRLLLQTNMSVMNVALACGFVSASHFTKCYRAFYGRTPYRERGATAAFAPPPEAIAVSAE